MGVLIKAFVTPPKAGFVIWLEWLRPDGVWARLEENTTDRYGMATWSYTFTSYPQAVGLDLPAGQVFSGVEYGGDSGWVELEDGQEGHFYLNPEPGEPSKDLDILGKIGAIVAGTGFVGILFTAARKRG